MFTKYSLVALLAVSSMVATSSDSFAGGKCHRIRSEKCCCCCTTAEPCAPAAAPAPAAVATTNDTKDGATYRSFSYEPSTPAPVYRAAAPVRTPSYFLSNMDPRKHNGGR